MRKLCHFIMLVSLAGVAAACSPAADIRDIPQGSDVRVETHGGSTVAGRLVRAADREVLLEQAGGMRVALRRDAIRTVTVAGDADDAETANPEDGPAPVDDPAVLYRELTVPAGTTLHATLRTTLASDSARREDSVVAALSQPVEVDGVMAIPAGSELRGSVTAAERAGRVKGRARLAFRFDTLKPVEHDTEYAIATAAIGRQASGTKQEDAATIALPALGGAVIGGIAGGKKGAVIGSAVGGGAGAAVVLSTRGDEIVLPRGTTLTVSLEKPLTVRVRP